MLSLLNNSGGSGYDIACAQNNYNLILKRKPIVDKVSIQVKETFILFILIKNKVAKQQLQTIKITKAENINKVLMQLTK
jgi:hypothetical protein